MDHTERIADRIQRAIPKIPSGSLRFWGEWFGRPYDNRHTLISCRCEQNVLRLCFDQGETLSVWAPDRLNIDRSTFRISDADRVRWEWFYYGRPQTPANLYYEDFVKSADGISASTNTDWCTPAFNPTKAEAAVELQSLMH
jgi:hypothetical protein